MFATSVQEGDLAAYGLFSMTYAVQCLANPPRPNSATTRVMKAPPKLQRQEPLWPPITSAGRGIYHPEILHRQLI